MGKDKKKNEAHGKIIVMRQVELTGAYSYVPVANAKFDTTEKAKRWLRKNGRANANYLIAQIRFKVSIQQEMITKLIATPPSTE